MPPRNGILLAFGAALSACGSASTTKSAADTAEATVAALPVMDDARLLSRLSLDLRGVRPTPAELETLAADPSRLAELTEDFLHDPRFEERVQQLYAEVYLTRADAFLLRAADFGEDDEVAFARAVGEEPIRLVARVAAEDRPWTDIVTVDWTMANESNANAWNLDYSGPGWAPARYQDGRPAAGVLSTNGMWWRYGSTASNANRKRANQVSRILLCNDYLVRPITFDRNVDLLDQDAVEDAIANNPDCANCHISLDPLAAYFFGFWNYAEDSYLEASSYHPERERLWADVLGTSPAYYGQPGTSLADLGRQIASDPRFPTCAVEQVFEGLLRREVEPSDMDALTAHREAFLQDGLRMRALFRSIVQDPRYRSADVEAADDAGAVPVKMVTPDQLVSQVAALTGYQWTYQGADMLSNDLVGLRTLAGGADGVTVNRSARSPNATIVLVQERLAELAGVYAVEQAIAEGHSDLFAEIDLNDTPASNPDGSVAQIVALHKAIFGRTIAPDGPEVAANLDLYAALLDIDGSPPAAWAGLLVALLRDPDFLLY